MITNVSSQAQVIAPSQAKAPEKPVYGPVLPTPKTFEPDSAPTLDLKRGGFEGPPVDFDLGEWPKQDPVANAASAALSIKKSGLSTDADFIAPGARLGFKVSAKKMKLEEALMHNIPIDQRPRDYRAMVTLRVPLGGNPR